MRSSPNSPRYATDPWPADKPDTDANRSIRQASITAGAGLLLMSALAGFGYQVAVKGLVTQGNAAKTATDIMAHQRSVPVRHPEPNPRRRTRRRRRMGALPRVQTSERTHLDARCVAQDRLRGDLRGRHHPTRRSAPPPRQRPPPRRLPDGSGTRRGPRANQHLQRYLGRVSSSSGFTCSSSPTWAYRSSFVPKLLTVLLAIAGLGYLFDSFGRAAGSSPDVSAFTFIGEFLLALWLVTRGRGITLSESGSHDGLIVGAAR